MKIVVLDAGTLGDDLDFSPLSRVGEAVIYDFTSLAQLPDRIADAEVIVTNKHKLNGTNIPGAPKLKLICVTATGFDGIDTVYCRTHGIGVCNIAGYSTQSVAQLTMAMALMLYTHLHEYRDYVHSGAYTKSGIANHVTPGWQELCGKTWGIVGGGNIGRRVAQMARTMGCRVIVFRRRPDPEFETVDLHTLCRESDIISLHVPLHDETRGLIGRAELTMMEKHPVLINVARGPVTDELAVTEALESGRISALGVDVYSVEPFGEDHPFQRLLDMPNVCLTPHMAWGAVDSRNRCIAEVAENIAAFRRGENRNRVD